METSTTTLLSALLIALVTLIPAAATWLQRSNRAARKDNRALRAVLSQRDERLMVTRRAILLHNEKYHLRDDTAWVPLPPLPDHTTQEDEADE